MGLLDRFRSLDSRRRTLLERAPAGPLKAYYSVPFVSPKDDFRSIEYTALDFETTGLEVGSRHTVARRSKSARMAPMTGREVQNRPAGGNERHPAQDPGRWGDIGVGRTVETGHAASINRLFASCGAPRF